MHVGDTIFIFCLALIIFGPKKLPEIGRQIGKLMVEFRRASNEFKMQIEEELRASEESERQKEIAAAASQVPASAGESALPEEASSSGTPVIAPPSTGLPVNHTFPSTESGSTTQGAATGAAVFPVDEDTYLEPEGGFNPGLNTASNGLVAETAADRYVETPGAATESVAFEPAEGTNPLAQALESQELESEKAQAPVHHG